jgi:hypothetical protein
VTHLVEPRGNHVENIFHLLGPPRELAQSNVTETIRMLTESALTHPSDLREPQEQ